jgi:V/A-type H+-transporting ATPase subunit C
MGLVDYAYSNTRIRVMRSKLLSERELEALTRAKSLDDFVASLKQTHYGDVLSGVEKADAHEVEKHLRMDLLRAVRKLFALCPERCYPFIEAAAKKYEFNLIKFILNSQAGNVPQEKIDARLPIGRTEALLDGETEEFLSKLGTLPPEELASSLKAMYPGLGDFLHENDKLSILLALDQYYFAGLRSAVGKLKGPDKKTAAMLVSLEADAVNVLIIMRAVSRGLDAKKFIIPGKGYYLKVPEEYVADDASGVMKKLSSTPYKTVLEEPFSDYVKTKSFFSMEMAMKTFLIKQSRAVMLKYPFRLDYVLGYLKLKEMEVEDLSAICFAIGENVHAEKIGSFLVSTV